MSPAVVEVAPAQNQWQILVAGVPMARFDLKKNAVGYAEREAERRQAHLRIKRQDGTYERHTSKYSRTPGY